MPERIQLSRAKGWRKPPNTVVVARPSRWGNPFEVGSKIEVSYRGVQYGNAGDYWRHVYHFDLGEPFTMSAELAVALFRRELVGNLEDTDPDWDEMRDALAELRGKNLACWCPLVDQNGDPVPCHADVLLQLANR